MPARPARICPCGHRIPGGTLCACQERAAAERRARAEARRPSARERGYDSKWDAARKAYLALHPHCVRCGQPANVVDHITPHKGDQKLFWRRSNWQALCASPCHNKHKQREERQ
jgi:5-methylcytosine-specific restriction endonuclease McrA